MISQFYRRFSIQTLRKVKLPGGVQISVNKGNHLKEDTLTTVNPTDMWLLHLKRKEVDGEEVEVPTEIIELAGKSINNESDEIIEKFRKPIPFGNCIPTNAGDLSFKKIIHTVPPFYVDGGYEKPVILKSCVWNSL